MDDLISRQEAIDEIKGFKQSAAEWRDEQEERSDIWHRADSAIASALEIGLRVKKLPSAQPELITVNIDHELTQEEYEKLRKDMANAPVMLLPSAQPESDEYARGYNDAKREIALSGEYKRAYQRGKEDAQQWIPCSERLPEEEGWYLVTIQNDKTRKRRTENDLFAIGIAEAHKHTPYKFCKDGHRQTVIAWMPIPEPYKT